MNDIFKFWLKLFSYYAFSFCIVFYFIFLFVPHFYRDLVPSAQNLPLVPAWVGSFAGLLLAIYFSIVQTQKQIGSSGLIPLFPSEKVTLASNLKTSYEKMRQVLVNLDFKIDEKDTNEKFIKARTKFSMLSTGDISVKGNDLITVSLEEDKDKTIVTVSSKTNFPISLADGGRNLSNVHKIISALGSR